MQISSKNIRNILLVAVLMSIALICRYVDLAIDNSFIGALLLMIRNTIHISIVVVWTVSIYMRVINKRVRNMLIAVGMLMVCWLVVRTCKWEFLYGTDVLTRYLWYAFYIPMILIPLLGVFITTFIGKPDSFELPKKYRLLYLPAFLLIILVFTNDIHRLVFDFPDGIYYFDTAYTYEPAFFVVCTWFVFLGFYFVLKLLIKSRVPGSRSFQKVHIFIMGGSVVFWCLYATGIIEADLTAVDCTFITLLLESAIQSGLIRTNTNYNNLFEISSVTAQIADEAFNPRIVSAGAERFSKEVMQSAVVIPQNLGDFILNCDKIPGGYVFWQDDIKDINELIEVLQDTQTQLSENNYLLQAELELKEKQVQTKEKTRIFNQLLSEISPQLEKAKQIILRTQENAENRNSLLSQLSFIGAYIKRRGNLFLIAEEYSEIKAREIEFCIIESLDNLRLLDVHTALSFELEGNVKSVTAIKIYDLFENITEKMLLDISAVFVKIFCDGGNIVMRLMFAPAEGKKIPDISAINSENISVSCEHSDLDAVFSAVFTQGGEKK